MRARASDSWLVPFPIPWCYLEKLLFGRSLWSVVGDVEDEGIVLGLQGCMNNIAGSQIIILLRIFFFELWVYLFIYLFIYLWLCWVFVSARGLSLVVASRGHSSSRCVGLSLSRPLLLRSTGSGRTGSVVVAHGPSRSTACGIFPDQGSNPCPLHWQADSQPLRHQGSPTEDFLMIKVYISECKRQFLKTGSGFYSFYFFLFQHSTQHIVSVQKMNATLILNHKIFNEFFFFL